MSGNVREALEGYIRDAVVQNLTLDWGDAMDTLYDALLLDLKENAKVDAHLCMKDYENVEDGSELYISPYMDYTSVGPIIPLSELLIDAVDTYGAEAVSQALETSLARFRAEDQED